MSLQELLNRPVSQWMNGQGPDRDVALGSRIRLARNLKGLPFPSVADQRQAHDVLRQVREAVTQSPKLRGMLFVAMDSLSPLERHLLMERHLISPAHAREGGHKAVVLRNDEVVSVMVNEEDHLRIQVLLPGLQLSAAWELADQVDDALEQYLPYAFLAERGYLTACPTNVGTGLRASLMVHLPALASTGQVSRIIQAVGRLGLVVRGLYGEGTQALGNIFQFSNQVTLGHSEADIVQHLINVTRQVIDQEREARQMLLRRDKLALEDRVARAYGTLAHARVVSSQEALQLLSDVRLGIDLGLLDGLKPEILQELLVAIRPAHLQRRTGRELSPAERDVLRAALIRERIAAGNREEN